MTPEPSPALRLARRTLDHVLGVLETGDWEWRDALQRWSLSCCLSTVAPGHGIPAQSDWYILASPDYPWGSVKIVPAAMGGIEDTYWHQSYNGAESENSPWRTGDLCLSTTVRVLGRSGLDAEPFRADTRLRWHVERAIQWLVAASQGTLVLPGEPFELPQYPSGHKGIFAFSESPQSLNIWCNDPARVGIVELLPLQRGERIFIPRCFRDMRGRGVYAPTWGDMVNDSRIATEIGLWIRLDGVPVLTPWKAPATWGELRAAARRQNIDLDALLKKVVPVARAVEPILLCVGFPIPALVGGCPTRFHWLATLLPALTEGNVLVPGFRPGEAARWLYDRNHALADKRRLRWIDSENWDMKEITARGSLPGSVADRDALLIGAGALGAPLARLLVRAGVRSLVIVDEDILKIGNLSRHPLDTDHLSLPKANSLAAELRHVSPHLRVRSIPATFPNLSPEERKRVLQCDLIIDCTAEDGVIQALEKFGWDAPQTKIISLSLGMEAKRLFCYAADAADFSEVLFREAIAPWLNAQAEAYKDSDLPREGVGCWHPVFPARIDDVWLFVATAIKEIERVVRDNPEPALTVFEQTADEHGSFTGIRRVMGAPEPL